MKVALGIEYCGTDFFGWQVQPTKPTVQRTVEEAIGAFLCKPVATICAGRTDTAVHATGQVVSFDTDAARPENSWVRGVNSFLPKSVSVRWARRVPDDFSARFSARSRTYEYWIYNSPTRSPVLWNLTGWVFRELDAEKMQQGARYLLGEHDFSSFRASECQAATPVRTVHRLEVTRRGELVGIRIEANAFLQHMVRNIIGTLVYVGTGRERPEWVADVLAAKCRDAAAPTFSPSGLYLTGVRYEEPGLPLGGISPFGWPPAG
ncbi:MAG: tRNA pseudouridine synthase A [Burkholderia sp.]